MTRVKVRVLLLISWWNYLTFSNSNFSISALVALLADLKRTNLFFERITLVNLNRGNTPTASHTHTIREKTSIA